MAFDSSIRIRQINQSELSGYLATVILGYLSQTGTLTGSFYPLLQNPSGYEISGAFISQQDLDSAIVQLTSLVSQNYYPNTNPSGFISNINTGGFLTTGQTGNFTGIFYPLTTNPSGYITTGQTGNLTGVFYPLNTNPSGFITTGQTGNFGGVPSNGLLKDTNSIISVDYYSRYLRDVNGNLSANYNSRIFQDSSGHVAIDYGNRYLKDSGNTISVDFNHRQLLGNWSAQNLNLNTGFFGYLQSLGPNTNTIIGSNYIILTDISLPYSYNTILNGTGILTTNLSTTNANVSNLTSSYTTLTGPVILTGEGNNQAFIEIASNAFMQMDSGSFLYAGAENGGIDVYNNYLVNSGGNTSLDWNKMLLTGGTWSAQNLNVTSGITITGNITYNSTGSYTQIPLNTGSPVSWMPITVTGSKYFIPLYQ